MPTTPHPGETVSVVIPTRNRSSMVVAAVQSALAQTHTPLEVLVIIDGPEEDPGRSEQALAAIADPRLRVLALPASVGGGEARNLGVRGVSGDWIAFLDDDDLWLPHKLETQLTCAHFLAQTADLSTPRLAKALHPSATPSPAQSASSRPAEAPQEPAIPAAPPRTARSATGAPQELAASPAPLRTAQYIVVSCPVLARSPHWEEVWPRESYRPGQPMSEYLFCRRGWRYGSALLQTSTLLVPRELLLQVPFTPNLPKHQDWDWLLRVAARPGVSVHSAGSQPLAVFHVEGNRSSVGRARNWRFSLAWARERRALFTPRAFAGFLATECAAQATNAPWPERAALVRTFLQAGLPHPAQLLQLAAFLLIPQSLRRRLRNRLRPRPTNPPTAPLATLLK